MQLEDFDVSHNVLTGTLPSLFGASFTNLAKLSLSFNELSGSLPSLWKDELPTSPARYSLGSLYLPALQVISIRYNRFSGPIFDAALSPLLSLVSLTSVDLSHNGFYGDLGQWLKYFYCDNSECWFAATGLSTITMLYMGDNRISASLPSTIPDFLVLLDISNANITGSIPETFSELSMLVLTNTSISADEYPSFLTTESATVWVPKDEWLCPQAMGKFNPR